ncbi:MAG: tetratricopeptide repeat protein [Phycisphaerae bacterium]
MMARISLRHGCLFLVVEACLAGVAGGEGPVVPVRSSVVDIEYVVNEDALPLDSVQLWYTLDHGATWQEYGLDEDRQSPITFHAPREGLYGFFLVASNATGPSSVTPTGATQPHQWAFVDNTPPIVQLHPLRQTIMLGQRVLQIRWTAIDAHFGPRPVEITYQQPPDESWHPVTLDSLANTGQYDWRLPEDLHGPITLRLAVSDRGGHRVISDRQVFEIARASLNDSPTAMSATTPVTAGSTSVTAPALSGSPRAKKRASRLFAEAVEHRKRSEFREGIARLREAVRLDPERAEAFAEMADMLYRVGDWDRALNAYELALRQQPTMRAALRGAAIVYRQRNDHAMAARYLRAILRYNPNDAEVWMNLGDIAVFQGDEVLARECYTRATEMAPDASQVVENARKRLALMTEVSRTYRHDDR